MLDVLPIEPMPETSAGTEPTLMTSRAGRAATSTPERNRVAGPAWELGDLGLTTPRRSDHADTLRFTRAVSTVDALAAAGRLREAIELARATLAAGVPTVPAAKLKCALSSLLYSSGRVAEAATEAGRLLADPDLPEDVHEAAEVVVLEAVSAFEDVVYTGDRTEDAEAIVASRGRNGDEVVVVALTNLAHTAWAQGRVSDALDLIRQAVRLHSAGPPSHRPHPRLWLAGMLTCLRRFDEAGAQLRIVRDEDDRLGLTAFAAVYAANLHLATGRVHAAAVEVDAGLATADAWGTELFTPWALSILATVALRRGDLAAAARHTDGGERQRAATGPSYGYPQSIWVAAQVAAARVGSHEALRVLGDVLDGPDLLRRLLLTEPAAAAWLVRTSLACADRTHAEAVLAQVNGLAADNPDLPTLAAAAAHANGLFHRDPSALQRATRAHQDPWARASAAEDLAALLAHQGRDDDAVTCYCHAIEDYQQSGSPWDATRARGKLRALSVRMRHQTCIDGHASGWAGVTNAERTVTDKVATETFLRAPAVSVPVPTVRLGAEASYRNSHIADAVNG